MITFPSNRKELLTMLLNVAKNDSDIDALAALERLAKPNRAQADSLARMLQDVGFRGHDAHFYFTQMCGNAYDYRTDEQRIADIEENFPERK